MNALIGGSLCHLWMPSVPLGMQAREEEEEDEKS